MRNFCFALAALFAVTFLSSCDNGDSFDNSDVMLAYPGVLIFKSASNANDLSMDGMSVMMRFLILQAEMADKNIEFTLNSDEEPDWDKLGTFDWAGYTDLDKRGFLFGSEKSVKLKMIGENQYLIDYDGESYAGGVFDSAYRRGKYVIDTKGISIDEATESEPWTLSLYNDGEMAIAASDKSKVATAYCSVMELSFWAEDSNGKYRFDYYTEMRRADKEDEEFETQSWQTVTPGYLTIKNIESLLIKDTIGKNIELDMTGKGTSIYGDQLLYDITEPLIYNFTSQPYGKFKGKVRAEVFEVEAGSFPKTSVGAEYIGLGYVKVTYDGHEVTY